jgi:hypothetical protein
LSGKDRPKRNESDNKHTLLPNGKEKQMRQYDAEGKLLTRHPPIELAVAENTLFALPPINRIVPTTKTKMTASISI